MFVFQWKLSAVKLIEKLLMELKTQIFKIINYINIVFNPVFSQHGFMHNVCSHKNTKKVPFIL